MEISPVSCDVCVYSRLIITAVTRNDFYTRVTAQFIFRLILRKQKNLVVFSRVYIYIYNQLRRGGRRRGLEESPLLRFTSVVSNRRRRLLLFLRPPVRCRCTVQFIHVRFSFFFFVRNAIIIYENKKRSNAAGNTKEPIPRGLSPRDGRQWRCKEEK